MRVLFVHNAYQRRGGEDAVVEAEVALLRDRGHEVELYFRHNDELITSSRFAAATQTLWSKQSAIQLKELVTQFKPDLLHVHNTFPLISPAIYWTAANLGIPVVQTLHNFRLLCPEAMLLWNGKVCEDCLGRLPGHGVLRKCYRGSLAQTTVLAGMLILHRALGTWQKKVTRYIALNHFSRNKFIQGGLPAERITVKPNFVDVPRSTVTTRTGGLFVGRLSPEKGIEVLINALEQLPETSVELIGTGPEQERVANHRRATYLGAKSQDEVIARMRGAAYLVLPSICYENFPRTLVEAYACGLPVIASRLGAMAELVRDGETGLLFEPGNAEDLAHNIAWAEANPERIREMGEHARKEYDVKYTAQINYHQLIAIYKDAIVAVKLGQTN